MASGVIKSPVEHYELRWRGISVAPLTRRISAVRLATRFTSRICRSGTMLIASRCR